MMILHLLIGLSLGGDVCTKARVGPVPPEPAVEANELGVWIQTGETPHFLVDLPSHEMGTPGITVRFTLANDATVDFASVGPASSTTTGGKLTWRLVMTLTEEAVHAIASSQPRTVDYEIGENSLQIPLWGDVGRTLQLDFACMANQFKAPKQ
ncbi:MAG: hypothetical protein HN348_15005 [Proteobacteria bacterium]|jgi:hypothetical protein|nr:hypothetical protein [Pseudomonadota bacterium]